MTEALVQSSEDFLAHIPLHLRKPFLRRDEAAEYLDLMHGIRIAPATLAKFASTGGGPAFRKSMRTPLYSRSELDRWAESRLSGPQGVASGAEG